MKLYNYWRSSASYRARIALALKGVPYEYVSVNLATGESASPAYLAVNPQGVVPTLEDGGKLITQSIAICEYLDETHPRPPLLPSDPAGRARVRAIALAVACEIHAVGNLRVSGYLAKTYGASEAQRMEWMAHWVSVGFGAIEELLANSPETGRFCHGDAPTLADVVLLPQVYNAHRVKLEMAEFPTILRIEQACVAHPAFIAARPEAQPDAPR